MKKIVFFIIGTCLFLVIFISFGGVYKWTDEEGNIHYGDTPPKQKKINEVDIKPAPPRPKLRLTPLVQKKQHFEGQSLSFKELGPLPSNASSQYLTTQSSGVSIVNYKVGIAQFSISLKTGIGLPARAYFEAHFENPDNPGTPLIAGVSKEAGNPKIFIMSPGFKNLKCWNYQTVIYIYTDSTKNKLLGTHKQAIQSKINIAKVKPLTLMNILLTMSTGNCP